MEETAKVMIGQYSIEIGRWRPSNTPGGGVWAGWCWRPRQALIPREDPVEVDSSSSEFNRFLICSSWNSCYIQRGSRPRASGSAHLHVTWTLAETERIARGIDRVKDSGTQSGHPHWGEVKGARTKTAILWGTWGESNKRGVLVWIRKVEKGGRFVHTW